MEKYIPETYKLAINMLEPMIKKYDLDRITLESLVRSSIEIEEQDIQPVTAIWRNKKGQIYSTKASNIKVNLSFALSSLFRLKTSLNQKDFWLVLAIIHLIVDLFTMATKEVDEFSAVVLVGVYRLQHANIEKIMEYIKEICPKDLNSKVTIDSINEALKKLESWGCISVLNGEYIVNETVKASMIRDILK